MGCYLSRISGIGHIAGEANRAYSTRHLASPRSTLRRQGPGMTEAAGTDRRRELQELTIFHDVAKALTSSLNLDSVLQTIMEKISEYFRPDTWSLLMVDENKDELYFAIAVGPAADTLKNLRLKVGEGIAGWVAKHAESLIVPDVYTDPRFAKRIDEMTKSQTRSIIRSPLKSKHRTLARIQLTNCASSTSPSATVGMSSWSCCRRREKIPAWSWPSACAMASAARPSSTTRTCTSTCAAPSAWPRIRKTRRARTRSSARRTR